MTIFVDTSALYAVLDRDDRNHSAAKASWTRLLESGETLLTTNYVVVETTALVQSRLGLQALQCLHTEVLPVLQVHWISEDEHRTAATGLLVAARKDLSLVDCTSFEVMRRLGLTSACAFDRHFGEQGFRLLS